MNQKKSILLLGSSGFVGSNLKKGLSKYDEEFEILAPSSKDLDALCADAVEDLLSNEHFDVVLNCLDGKGPADALYGEKRMRMYLNLARCSKLYGKMIYFGTGAEYGRQKPLIDVKEVEFGERIPLESYGFAMYQMALHTINSSNIYDFRLFGIFGPQESWEARFISNAIMRSLFGFDITIRQNRVMDYLDISDTVGPIYWAINNTPSYHDYNLTSGRKHSLLEIAQCVSDVVDAKSKIIVCKEGMFPEYTANNDRIMTECDVFSVTPLKKSIENLAGFYEGMLQGLPSSELGIIKEKLLYPC